MLMLAIFIFMLSVVTAPTVPMEGAKGAVDLCLYAVIPSLFPFFVLNYMLMKSGAITSFCNRFLKPFTKIFNLPPCAAGAVILGFLSGYPAGTKAAGELYDNKQLNLSEYKHLTAFCSNAGPVFITGTVGVGMFGSERIGIILFLSHLLSAFAVGLLFRFLIQRDTSCSSMITKVHTQSSIQLFTEGVHDSLKSIAAVCGYVIFFGMLTAYAGKFITNFSDLAQGIITGFTEMTNGAAAISKASAPLALKTAAVSGIIGWGGLCVHAQSFCFLKSKKTYIAGKAVQGILSFVITYFACIDTSKFLAVTVSVITAAAIISIIYPKVQRQSRHF